MYNESAFCKMFQCTPAQVADLRDKNRKQLQAMYDEACRTGKRVNNYTREQLRQLINGLPLPVDPVPFNNLPTNEQEQILNAQIQAGRTSRR